MLEDSWILIHSGICTIQLLRKFDDQIGARRIWLDADSGVTQQRMRAGACL
jgi:hypothetical protein